MINSHSQSHPTSENSSITSDNESLDIKPLHRLSTDKKRSDNKLYKMDNNDASKQANRFTPTKGVSRIPEKMPAFPNRRKSKIEKDEELSQLKLGAMNQIQNTIKMTDLIKDKESKLSELQSENENLRKEVRSLKYQLEETKSINIELMEKLHVATDEKTRQKIESEDKRAFDFVDEALSPNASYDRYLRDILTSRDQLLNQNKLLKTELDNVNEQINLMKETIIYLESVSNINMSATNDINDAFIDSRSKTELLQLVRDNINDKLIWTEYAIKMTQSVVLAAPHLLHINNDCFSNEERLLLCCDKESNWASFAISLLQQFNKLYPNLIQDIILSQDSIPQELLVAKLSL